MSSISLKVFLTVGAPLLEFNSFDGFFLISLTVSLSLSFWFLLTSIRGFLVRVLSWIDSLKLFFKKPRPIPNENKIKKTYT